MSETKFTISVDSCVDRFSSFLAKNNVHCICLKRILNGAEIAEIYDSPAEFEDFYKSIQKGALPTTSQLNPSELIEYFNDIISKDNDKDIVHLSLSSGLSSTFDNCVIAANEVSKSMKNGKVYAFDTLSATLGIALMLDKLIEYRDSGLTALEAVKSLERVRDNVQVWAAVGNLFHLKRGGRISGVKATIGSLLNVKPVLIINSVGKLTIENTVKGTKKTIKYLINKLHEFGKFDYLEYNTLKVYALHTMADPEFALLRESVKKEFPHLEIVEGMIGPIIGTHVGAGAIGLVFEGKKRS